MQFPSPLAQYSYQTILKTTKDPICNRSIGNLNLVVKCHAVGFYFNIIEVIQFTRINAIYFSKHLQNISTDQS